MAALSALPRTLLALLLVLPVLSAPTTPNDPFHALSLRSPKPPDHPVCCLTPLPPLEPVVDDEILLSFEEWKERQMYMQAQTNSKAQDSRTGANYVYGASKVEPLSEAAPASPPAAPASLSADLEDFSTAELQPRQFLVPLTDRFNYASLDCSARVHTAHKLSKSPASILSSKKDRYMLSPCALSKGHNQYVVVELCEDIRIDTVQLANFEFFSGVFKDFSVSVAKTYTSDPEGWTPAGTYTAKNVRNVQSFHPPNSLRDFYRYIRIDFHSHYSSEYYCPVSLLRVYGLTHLEEWKLDVWEEESRAKRHELQKAGETVDAPEPARSPNKQEAEPISGHGLNVSANASKDDVYHSSQHSSTAPQVSLDGHADVTSTVVKLVSSSNVAASETSSNVLDSQGSKVEARSIPTVGPTSVNEADDLLKPTDTSSKVSPPTREATSISQISNAYSNSHSSEASVPAISESFRPSSSVPSIATASISIPLPNPPPPVPPVPTGGESIYRTIMNRLTALEANHTLYVRYVEGQTSGVREMLKKLSEDMGRLEGIGKAQAQMYQRTIKEWERQRNRLEMEHGELLSRVDYLSDEIVLEKRLGIAQLCLLLAVLVFMALTRGSRGEAFLGHGPATTRIRGSMREWGRRHLSFSSDWATRFRSRSPTPQSASRGLEIGKDKIEFPSSRTPLPPNTSRTPLPPDQAKHIKQLHVFASEKRISTAVTPSAQRSRTPTSIRTPIRNHNGHHHRPITPLGALNSAGRPGIQRANSQGSAAQSAFPGVGPVPKSAKKWARSAHLHEVRGKDSRDRSGRDQDRGRMREDRENDEGDVFRSPGPSPKASNGNAHHAVSDAFAFADKGGRGLRDPHHKEHLSPIYPSISRWIQVTAQRTRTG